MQNNTDALAGKVALITGAAHRIGERIARTLHGHGMNVVIHYRSPRPGAERLLADLLAIRADSACLAQADLQDTFSLGRLAQQAVAAWGRLDVLINNASLFYPKAIDRATTTQWDELMNANLKAPFFLSQACAGALRQSHGLIINITDIHAERPLREHPIYSITKAGLVMLTRALACELAPQVRVNAIAPGAILWPEQDMDADTRERIISRTFLKRRGDPDDIAGAAVYLVRDANYVSGQVLTVDGGRSLNS